MPPRRRQPRSSRETARRRDVEAFLEAAHASPTFKAAGTGTSPSAIPPQGADETTARARRSHRAPEPAPGRERRAAVAGGHRSACRSRPPRPCRSSGCGARRAIPVRDGAGLAGRVVSRRPRFVLQSRARAAPLDRQRIRGRDRSTHEHRAHPSDGARHVQPRRRAVRGASLELAGCHAPAERLATLRSDPLLRTSDVVGQPHPQRT